MFCLRSWLPLLFIPTNASPAFILLFFICTYFLNRPCVYCSLLLLILFFTSCNWSDNCFLDTNTSTWFDARPSIAITSTTTTIHNTTAPAYGSNKLPNGPIFWKGAYAPSDPEDDEIQLGEDVGKVSAEDAEWTGLGAGWIRNMLGKAEWTVDCLDLKVNL